MATLGFSLAQDAGSLVMGLLAGHSQRVKIAEEENQNVAIAVSALDADLKTIFTGLNNGDISETTALQALIDVHNWYWAFILPYQQGPTKGPQSPFPGSGKCYDASDGSGCHCSGTACTAGCCIGCAAIDPSLSAAYHVVSNHGGTFSVCAVVGNKYGLQSRASYTITYKQPAKLNTPLETTINQKTGVVSIGAAPGQNDVVITTGGITTNATDTGTVTEGPIIAEGSGPSQTSAANGSLGSSSVLTWVLILGAFVLFLSLIMPRRTPQAIVVAAPGV